MVKIHQLGLPRIGPQRELKLALEAYWRNEIHLSQLMATAKQIRQQNWQWQLDLDYLTVGDFSLYDQVLDMSLMLGCLPERACQSGTIWDHYFRTARGRAHRADMHPVAAAEMTKWWDTNYHYIVPELQADTVFQLQAQNLLDQIEEAKAFNRPLKVALIGPVSYLYLAKSKDGSQRLDLLERLLPVYEQLLQQLHQAGIEWVQMDEPALVTDLDSEWQYAYQLAYHRFSRLPIHLLLTTYFGELQNHLQLVCQLPVAGIHLDGLRAAAEIHALVDWLPQHKILSLGMIDGRNIWKADLQALLDQLEPIAERLGDRLWLAPSCSLLHVPLDLSLETELDEDLQSWLAFAVQKLDELRLLKTALNQGQQAVQVELKTNRQALAHKRTSSKVHDPAVQARMAQIDDLSPQRLSPYAQRAAQQKEQLKLPLLPTTTIGSFPQTQAIRQARRDFKQGILSKAEYIQFMQQRIAECVAIQEQIGLDVLVHGEPERNDMVEYFGEQLKGFAFTRHAWVQSYGSRCVKPPIIYGDVSRTQPMTVAWIEYAQSLTQKPMKGMLTGPVTLLNWSFVRDDQSRSQTCLQLALAIRDEVLDLERAGIQIIQIDEAALREGLPLRRAQWQAYLSWAIRAFGIAANGVKDSTQIHTHMCYSEFNDIMPAIAQMDADVITIETSRSDMELLAAFEDFDYPNEIGPGVYDIHSPNIPSVEEIEALLKQALRYIPIERLWVNPDCGLKTRAWSEVKPALLNMVQAAHNLRPI